MLLRPYHSDAGRDRRPRAELDTLAGALTDAGVPADDGPRLLTYPSVDLRLARPRDRLARITARRHSSRAFGPGRLSARQLGSLLSAFASGPDGNRSFPSAGALYPVEVMCLVNAVDGPDGRGLPA
ncbi:MAG TPA: hypothetical protein VGV63_05935 [Acidimicrobiales bacterium]|nr:hypothetical protein [Acidimicrobiales bacterium]